jgi:hypothetical protein
MRVRLTRKLAEALNGLDLRSFDVGEVLDLPPEFGRMLIAESWAVPADDSIAVANDQEPRRRRLRKQLH